MTEIFMASSDSDILLSLTSSWFTTLKQKTLPFLVFASPLTHETISFQILFQYQQVSDSVTASILSMWTSVLTLDGPPFVVTGRTTSQEYVV